ncbi:hypothetical protein WJX82_010312 [Trebouxia sp. C0006]
MREKYGPAPPPEVIEEEPAELLPTQETACLQGHDGPILAVRFNCTGTYCLTCGKDRTLRLWNPHRGVHIKTYAGHGYDVRDVCVSTDNSKLASCGGDRSVFSWDVATGRIIRKFRGHDGVANSIAYAASDEVLVTGGYDQAIRLWDCRSRSFEPIQTMKNFGDAVTSVAVADSVQVLGGSVDGTVRQFDVRMGMMFTDTLHEAVTGIAVSHDGNCVLASCLDNSMRLLDKASGEQLASYTGHTHQELKLDCAFTCSDAHVVSGSEDGLVCFWDLVDETMVHQIQAHQSAVCSIAIHPEAKCIVTASNDGSAKVWHPPTTV